MVLDEDVAKDIEKEVFKPRNHPGVVKPKTVLLPDAFIKAADIITQGKRNEIGVDTDVQNIEWYWWKS